MRTKQRATPGDRSAEKYSLPGILIRAKYALWNLEGRPLPDVHGWLCLYLDADRRKVGKGPTHWSKFRAMCKKLSGGEKVKVTKVEVWRHLTMYFCQLRHLKLLSDDESSDGEEWSTPAMVETVGTLRRFVEECEVFKLPQWKLIRSRFEMVKVGLARRQKCK